MAIDAEQIVRAATVIDRKDSVFCLGPFPKRVSFTAQQHRALNLVWALRKERAFAHGNTIAVVGAGLAGVTAAAAFAAYGCQVDIFETTDSALFKQKYTEHRLVHPTINRWPMDPLEPTSTLPFLEWYAASCSEVTKTITDEFKQLVGKVTLKKRHEVIDINPVATKLVKLTTKPQLEKKDLYALVLIAIGFGQERSAPSFQATDYWKPDNLEVERGQQEPPTFIVSGCGDGGLIDTLRLVHDEFEKGQLAFDVAATLSNTPLAKKIADVERSARRNKTAKDLPAVYHQAAADLAKATKGKYFDARRLLDDSLLNQHTVFLVDSQLDEPYSLNAAPIHKLMIAHAIAQGAVYFWKGTVTRAANKIGVAGRWFDAEPRSRVVVRHGAEFSFGPLVTDDQLADLRRKQEELSDDHADQLWRGAYPTILGQPEFDPTCPEFIKSRKKLATKAVSKIAAGATLKETKDGFTIEYPDRVPPQSPKRLFGIAVRPETLPTGVGIR